MKKISLFILLLSIQMAAFSQTEKGSWLIGGSATGGARLDKNTNDYYYFNITPQAGYFFFNNFAVGLAPNLGFYHYNFEKIANYGAGPFLRYYIGKSKVRFFLEAMEVFSFRSSMYNANFSNGPLKQRYHTWSENISAGMVYFINKNIGLEAKVQYANSRGKASTNTPASSIYIPQSNNLFLTLGFQIYIPAGQKESSNLPLKE